MQINVGIITVSDRASQGLYDDLGGPALKKAAQGYGWIVAAETLVPTKNAPFNAPFGSRSTRAATWSSRPVAPGSPCAT
jgi:molybdopterin biosynthesis enzyme MoaB